jgi:hypothetical protein
VINLRGRKEKEKMKSHFRRLDEFVRDSTKIHPFVLKIVFFPFYFLLSFFLSFFFYANADEGGKTGIRRRVSEARINKENERGDPSR